MTHSPSETKSSSTADKNTMVVPAACCSRVHSAFLAAVRTLHSLYKPAQASTLFVTQYRFNPSMVILYCIMKDLHATTTTATATATATAAATATTTTTTPYLAKNVPPLACNNFDAREWILIFFGRNVTDKVGNQKTLYYATSNNLCFCTTWQNGENMKITFFSQLHCVTHTMHLCAVFLKEKLSSVMCLIAPNIC